MHNNLYDFDQAVNVPHSMSESGVICKPSTTTPPPIRCQEPATKSRHRRYYVIALLNQTTLISRCHPNFHHLSGHLVRTCQKNGQWSGEELLCEVDYFMDRFRLSWIIILACFWISFVFLGTDFYLHYLHRKEVKYETLRQRVMQNKHDLLHSRMRPFSLGQHTIVFDDSLDDDADATELVRSQVQPGISPAMKNAKRDERHEEEFLGYGHVQGFREVFSGRSTPASSRHTQAEPRAGATLMYRIGQALRKQSRNKMDGYHSN